MMPYKLRPDVDKMIAYLNDLLSTDPVAIQDLIDHRVPCNEDLKKYPGIGVVGRNNGPSYTHIPEGECHIGLMGIIGGYLGLIEEGPYAGKPYIAMMGDLCLDEKSVYVFKVKRFVRYEQIQGVNDRCGI